MIADMPSPVSARRLALLALARIVQRVLIGPVGDGDALQADAEPGIVHHREHAGQTRGSPARSGSRQRRP